MHLIRIDKNNQVNGPGLRCIVWVAGCEHHCAYCHNYETWDPEYGVSFRPHSDFKIITDQLDKKEISGVTFSGGDPFYPSNREPLTNLASAIKDLYPNKTIWCYTGYLFEEIKDDPLVQYLDVIIDGKYIQSLNKGIGKHKWRGSANQRIIDVQKTLKEGHIVEYVEINGKTISENEQ